MVFIQIKTTSIANDQMEELVDDDMVLLIVGDEEVPMMHNQIPWPNIIQPESLDSEEKLSVDEILETVSKHGEYIKMKPKKRLSNAYSLDGKASNTTFQVKDEIKYETESDKEDLDYTTYENRGLKMHRKQAHELGDEEFSEVMLMEEHQIPKLLAEKSAETKNEIQSDQEDPAYIPDENGVQLKLHRKRTYMLRVAHPSFVQQLREENPTLMKNEKLLIEHLMEIMRSLKPPTPPPKFYKVTDDGLKYVCCVCKVKSDSLPAASRHYQAKHGERYLVCYACGVDFRVTTNLYKHEKRCVAPDAPIVVRARKLFLIRRRRKEKSSFGLQQPKRLYCTKCPASYRNRLNLLAHENSHMGIRPHHCSKCPAAYTSLRGLVRHMQIHGDTQYICDHCGRVFKLKAVLISHLETHKPIRRFGCEYCGRGFAQKNALVHHINITHLNLPPAHGCPVCPKRYARMTHVKEHMKNAHGLKLITRRMYYKSLPTLTNLDVEGTVVLDSEVDKLHSLVTEDQQNPKKRKKKNRQQKPAVEVQPVQNGSGIQETDSHKQGQKVFETVSDKEIASRMSNVSDCKLLNAEGTVVKTPIKKISVSSSDQKVIAEKIY